MGIVMTSGGVSKTYNYYPYDALYVDASGNLNANGNGAQVKEAWFNGVKYYPKEMFDISDIKIVEVPTGWWIESSVGSGEYNADFDMNELVVYAYNYDESESFQIPNSALEIYDSGSDYYLSTANGIVVNSGGGTYLYPNDLDAVYTIIGGDLGGTSFMRPRLLTRTALFVNPSTPEYITWVRGMLASGELYKQGRPSGMVCYVRGRAGSYDSGLRYLYASNISQYAWGTKDGEDVTAAVCSATFAISNFGHDSIFDFSSSTPINVTDGTPRDLMLQAMLGEFLGIGTIISVYLADEDDEWGWGWSSSDVLNYPRFVYLT